MARKKVNLAWIVNDSTRKATFKKRKKGLMKKASELVTLCGVKGCAIVFGPHEPRPEVWPSVEGAVEVLARFKSLPEMEQCKKMMNQDGFLLQQDAKLREQLRREERECRELQLRLVMHEGLAGRSLRDLGIEDAAGLMWVVDTTMRAVRERIEEVKGQTAEAGMTAAAVEALTAGTKEKSEMAMAMAMEGFTGQSWLMNSEYVGFGGQEMLVPYMDSTPTSAWHNTFFTF